MLQPLSHQTAVNLDSFQFNKFRSIWQAECLNRVKTNHLLTSLHFIPRSCLRHPDLRSRSGTCHCLRWFGHQIIMSMFSGPNSLGQCLTCDNIGKWQPIIPPQTVICLRTRLSQSSRRRRRKPMKNSCRPNSAKFEIDEIEIDRIDLTDNDTCKLDFNRSSNRSEIRKNNTFLRTIKKGSQALRHKQNKHSFSTTYSKWYLVCLDVLKQIPVVNQ